MRTHRANLPDYRSRDNSQCSISTSESDSEVETNSSVYQSVNSNLDSNYNSDSEDYQSADSHIDDLDHSNSDLDDNLPDNVEVSSTHNNESDKDNQSLCDNLESNQGDNQHQSVTDVNQCINQDESNLSSDKKLITDDAPDLSDTFHMLFSDPPVENKSTVDFVLQKQQEEMPDIIDSDGGE
jgi:hypothetical protein